MRRVLDQRGQTRSTRRTMSAARSPATTLIRRQPRLSRYSDRATSPRYCEVSTRCCSPSYSTANHEVGPAHVRGSSADSRPAREPVSASAAAESPRRRVAVGARSPSVTALPRRRGRAPLILGAGHAHADGVRRAPARRHPLKRVARASASRRSTARLTGPRRARSNAVRSMVVTAISFSRSTSSSSSVSSRATRPAGALLFGWFSSIAASSATHRAPCRAAAAEPQTTPRRRDHSQAAVVRSLSVSEPDLAAYTSGTPGDMRRAGRSG